jgi:O-methyltransferase involved in polyketide biosynthesis
MSTEPDAARGSESISPTAHYTGYVWARNGLSHPALRTTEGRVLYESLRPLTVAGSAILGVSLEGYLLARHRAIDAALTRAIEAGAVSHVIEVAAGLSPRGWRFTNTYGERITYVETDLPGMAARKREALDQIGSLGERHRVVELDALAEEGPTSLREVAGTLDPDVGLAIITEGLLNYLRHDHVLGIWERFASTLKSFPHGLYLSDLHLSDVQPAYAQAFRTALSGFVRGRVTLHFGSERQVREQLLQCGFDAVELRRASDLQGAGRGGELVHIIEASTSRSQPPSSTTRRARGATPRARR